jgi:hypothetical protein
MDGVAEALAQLVADELAQPVTDSLTEIVDAIRKRTGAGTAAVLFYGSCLRKRSHEGVLDFYVLVDGYRAANPRGVLALANALLPGMFSIEHPAATGVLRQVRRRFALRLRAGRSGPLAAGIWARLAAGARRVPARRCGPGRRRRRLRRVAGRPARTHAPAAAG